MAAPARNHRGPPCESRVGSAVSLHSNYVRGSFAFARSREILQVLRPRFHRRGHLVHRYYQKVSCLRYSCWWFYYLGPRRPQSCFCFPFPSSYWWKISSCSAIRTWSPYHGEGKAVILAQKTDRTRSSYWLVRPGSIHESLVQLSLGDTVEKYHAWLPPVLSFSRSHPARVGSAKKG